MVIALLPIVNSIPIRLEPHSTTVTAASAGIDAQIQSRSVVFTLVRNTTSGKMHLHAYDCYSSAGRVELFSMYACIIALLKAPLTFPKRLAGIIERISEILAFRQYTIE